MMKYVLLAALVTLAVARPQQDAQIVSSNNENGGEGPYKWDFKTSDGAEQSAVGNLEKNARKSNEPEQGYDEVQTVQGSYGHKTPEGKSVQITYVSDQNGYRPKVTIS